MTKTGYFEVTCNSLRELTRKEFHKLYKQALSEGKPYSLRAFIHFDGNPELDAHSHLFSFDSEEQLHSAEFVRFIDNWLNDDLMNVCADVLNGAETGPNMWIEISIYNEEGNGLGDIAISYGDRAHEFFEWIRSGDSVWSFSL